MRRGGGFPPHHLPHPQRPPRMPTRDPMSPAARQLPCCKDHTDRRRVETGNREGGPHVAGYPTYKAPSQLCASSEAAIEINGSSCYRQPPLQPPRRGVVRTVWLLTWFRTSGHGSWPESLGGGPRPPGTASFTSQRSPHRPQVATGCHWFLFMASRSVTPPGGSELQKYVGVCPPDLLI